MCEKPEKVKEWYPFLFKNYEIYSNKDEVANLYAMVRCTKGGICCNSTYSWWGAWLNTNNDKTICIPKKTDGIYMKGALVI